MQNTKLKFIPVFLIAGIIALFAIFISSPSVSASSLSVGSYDDFDFEKLSYDTDKVEFEVPCDVEYVFRITFWEEGEHELVLQGADSIEDYAMLVYEEDGSIFTMLELTYDSSSVTCTVEQESIVAVVKLKKETEETVAVPEENIGEDISETISGISESVSNGILSVFDFLEVNKMTFILIILAIFLVVILVRNIRIVSQGYVFVVERLGKYHATWDAGLHVKIPFIDNVVAKISLKEQVLDFKPQPVITKDNVTMQIDSVVFCKVFDPKLYQYGAENPLMGLNNLTSTTLRSIVGDMELDQTLTSRETINAQMQAILDEATDKWGLKVIRVEIKNINPPDEIEKVMTKQMRAERERRQTILEAQAHKEAVVSRAEGDKKAKILAAEAERDAKIATAEGEAKAIELVYQAEAEGIKALNAANMSEQVLKLKGIEALKDVADGRATKIYMPTDIANSIASLGVAGEALGIGDATAVDTSPKPEKKPEPDPCCEGKAESRSANQKAESGNIDF